MEACLTRASSPRPPRSRGARLGESAAPLEDGDRRLVVVLVDVVAELHGAVTSNPAGEIDPETDLTGQLDVGTLAVAMPASMRSRLNRAVSWRIQAARCATLSTREQAMREGPR